jgi:hypothetical protein
LRFLQLFHQTLYKASAALRSQEKGFTSSISFAKISAYSLAEASILEMFEKGDKLNGSP